MKLLLIAMLSIISFTASAGSIFVEVPVLDVRESYRDQRVNDPVRTCYDVESPRYQSNRRSDDYSGEIIGGIAGGIIGNQVGRGRGRDAATAAGAIIGTIVGGNISDNNRTRSYGGEIRRHCEVQNNYSYQQVRDGYIVTYELLGKRVSEKVRRHPGDTIKVRVSFNAVR